MSAKAAGRSTSVTEARGAPVDVTGPAGAAAAAHQAVLLAQTDPRQAKASAAEALRRAGGDAEVASRAERAIGLAAKELNDLTEAEAHLRRAVSIAQRAGLAQPEAEARISLALTLAYCGRTTAALRQADLAAPGLQGLDAARLQMQLAIILTRLGRQEEAFDGFRRALTVFRQLDDRLWEARLLCNRGVLHAYRLELAAARNDLQRALGLSEELGQQWLTGGVCQNLGYVEARAGDIPAALDWYDRADRLWRALDVPRAVLLQDRCEALLSVGLHREGREAAEQAVAELEHANMAFDLAEARLTLAQAALLEGDFVAARETAALAQRAFAHQQRRPWAVLARYIGARARWLGGERTPASLAAARRVADDLMLAGWTVPSLDARVMAGRIALELGRADTARAQLTRASRARQRGPVDLRVRAWHAEGLLRLAEGDRRGADKALQAGVRLVHRYRHTLAATELRAHSASHGTELAALGVRLAVDDGRPERVLAWAERARAGVLLGRPARPPDDEVLVADLAELRQVAGELQEAVVNGRSTSRLLHREAELEDIVRRRARQARPAPAGADGHPGEPAGDHPGEPPSIDALTSQLGDSILVEMIDLDGALSAVVVGAGSPKVVPLGSTAEVASEVSSLRFALRRLATGHGGPASRRAARDLFEHVATRLQALLLDPVAAGDDDRPLVLVPTGPLHAMPWAALPVLTSRPLTVVPSAALWLASAAAKPPLPTPGPSTSLIAGPGLTGAEAEIADLAGRYASARVLTGAAATVVAVTGALDGADLAHVACHGTFRADNPLFSALTLADGALTVYDLERLVRAPRRVVLSACDAGLSGVRPGDAVMGLAAALLALGSQTLIASVAPVPDDGARVMMADLHTRLARGMGPSAALAASAGALDQADHRMVAVRAAFVCFGSG